MLSTGGTCLGGGGALLPENPTQSDKTFQKHPTVTIDVSILFHYQKERSCPMLCLNLRMVYNRNAEDYKEKCFTFLYSFGT